MKTIMWRIMNFMMLSCKRSSELIEKKLHFGLTPLESFQLGLHTSMCSACTAYQKQSDDLHRTLDKFTKEKQDLNGSSEIKDISELKVRIIRKIEKR